MASAALRFLGDPAAASALVAAQHRAFDGLAADRITRAVLDRCGK